jgi:hypothetical protein
MLSLKKIINLLVDKIFKKEKVKEEVKVKERKYLEPVETTIAVKMLKDKFKKPEEQEKVITKESDGVNEDTFTPFVYYLEQRCANGLEFPKPSEMEKDLGIGRNKRLAFCNKAVEIGILYKPTSTSFDYASNKGG